jgi:hypothetical protein
VERAAAHGLRGVHDQFLAYQALQINVVAQNRPTIKSPTNTGAAPLYSPHAISHLAQFSPIQGSRWLKASSAKVATRATTYISVAAYALQYRSALVTHHFPTKSAKKENHATQFQHAAMHGILHLQWCRRLSQLKRLPQPGHETRELSISQALSPGRSWRDISTSRAAVSG